MNNLGQREQFGTDIQASPLNRIHVDCEPHPVIFQIELDFTAPLREILAFPDHKRTHTLQIAQNFRQKFILPRTDKNDLAGFQIPCFIDSAFHDLAIVDTFSSDDLV
ncbi:MAG TPA: hypothetical protein VN785_08415 [Candidatus Angelobacter sp.]|nr:hypothetical protein [Candidatus Angelobacter sp.]